MSSATSWGPRAVSRARWSFMRSACHLSLMRESPSFLGVLASGAWYLEAARRAATTEPTAATESAEPSTAETAPKPAAAVPAAAPPAAEHGSQQQAFQQPHAAPPAAAQQDEQHEDDDDAPRKAVAAPGRLGRGAGLGADREREAILPRVRL